MNINPKFPLYLPGVKNETNNNVSIIGVNLREDTTTLAYFISNNGSIETKIQKNYSTKDYSGFSNILSQFLKEESLENVERLGISVPGPVINGKSSPARLNWTLDEAEYRQDFGFKSVVMLNDQEAAAYGIALLDDSELESIYTSDYVEKGNLALLAPGNGLGEAGYFFDGKYLRPFATEGGHSEFSPRTNVEVEFYQFLNHIYGIVSWENVLSKSGLFNIYRFLRDVKRHPEPEWLTARFAEGDFFDELLNAVEKDDAMICKITLDTFIEFLAREANNLTLKLKATGGLLIAGDIPMRIKKFIDKEKFYEKFKISDKMENMMKNIPIYVVNTDDTSVNGVALYAAYHE